MKVIKGFNSCYTLLDLTTGKETDFRVSDMRLFVFDSAVIDPEDIARRDHMEYFIEEILGHRGNLKKKSEIEFLVSWLGFSVDCNSWEPFANLRDTEQPHHYLTRQKLQRLIPLKFR